MDFLTFVFRKEKQKNKWLGQNCIKCPRLSQQHINKTCCEGVVLPKQSNLFGGITTSQQKISQSEKKNRLRLLIGALNIGAHGRQFLFQVFIAAVEVIDTQHIGGALGNHGRQHQAHAGPQISTHHRCAF